LVNIPEDIPIHRPHECFGYRALEGQIPPLADFFKDVSALCGTSTLACPAPTLPVGPERAPTQPPSRFPKPSDTQVVDQADLAVSQYEFDYELAQIMQRAYDNEEWDDQPMTAGVRLQLTSLLHRLIATTLDVIY
jgi:hypothetical protein